MDGRADRPRHAAEEFPAAAAVERLLAWTAPVRAEQGLDDLAARAQRRAAPARAYRRIGETCARSTPPPSRRPRTATPTPIPGGPRAMSAQDPSTAGPAGAQPTEEELRAAYEAELKRIRVEDVSSRRSSRCSTSAPARPAWRRARRTSATSSRSARPSRARARCCRSSSRSWARTPRSCARRCRSCRSPTLRRAERGPPRRAPEGQAGGAPQEPAAGRARARGRRRAAAGCGCPGSEPAGRSALCRR